MAIVSDFRKSKRPDLIKRPGSNPSNQVRTATTSGGLQISGSASNVGKAMVDPVRPTAQINRFNARQALAARPSVIPNAAAPVVSRPQILTRANSPGMGWQQRKALNDQLQENYRSELAAQTSRANTDLTNATSRANTQLEAETSVNTTNIREQGATARQGLQNQAEAAIQDTRGRQALELESQRSKNEMLQDEARNKMSVESEKERQILDLIREGRITEPGQIDSFRRFGPESTPGLRFGQDDKYTRINPKFEKYMDKGVEKFRQVSPGGRFNDRSGIFDPDITSFDPETGTTSFDTKNLTDEELDILYSILNKGK